MQIQDTPGHPSAALSEDMSSDGLFPIGGVSQEEEQNPLLVSGIHHNTGHQILPRREGRVYLLCGRESGFSVACLGSHASWCD